MDIQEILKKYTKDDGTIDYEAVNKAIEHNNAIQTGAVKSKALEKQKERLEQLEKENEKLKKENETVKGQEEYYKGRIVELEDKYNETSTTLGTLEIRQKAKEFNVDEAILDNLLNSGVDPNKVDLTPFHNTKKPTSDLGDEIDDDEEDNSNTGGNFTKEEIVARSLEMAEND